MAAASPPSVRIPLMKSTFYREAETAAALAAFVQRTGRLSMGVECAAFEAAFAAVQRRRYAVLVTNGSMANLVLVQSLLNLARLRPGDPVGFSALTWATNVMPLFQHGLAPVPVDCELGTLNVSSRLLAPHLGTLRALFLTNVLGFCDDLAEIRRQCDAGGVLLLEDNCEALGSSCAGTPLGSFSLASTCSFFVGHQLSTIEGGMICTDDEELWHMLLAVRSHGWDRHLPPAAQEALRARHDVDPFYGHYTFYDLAYNARPTEITGFLGHTQLPWLPEMTARRAANFARFHAETTRYPAHFRMLDLGHMDCIANFAMPIVCRSEEASRRQREAFGRGGVEVRPVIAGDITQHPFYRRLAEPASCPNAALVHQQGFYFPNHPELSVDEVDLLCRLLRPC